MCDKAFGQMTVPFDVYFCLYALLTKLICKKTTWFRLFAGNVIFLLENDE